MRNTKKKQFAFSNLFKWEEKKKTSKIKNSFAQTRLNILARYPIIKYFHSFYGKLMGKVHLHLSPSKSMDYNLRLFRAENAHPEQKKGCGSFKTISHCREEVYDRGLPLTSNLVILVSKSSAI